MQFKQNTFDRAYYCSQRSKIHKKSRLCNLNLRGLHRDHSEWSIRQREQDLTPPALTLKEVGKTYLLFKVI